MNIKKELRQECILLSLKKLDFLSRSQLQKIHRLGKTRNTNRVLKEMEPFLSSSRHENGEYVYYLNREGRERVNSLKICKKSNQVDHYLMRNSLYISHGCPASWKNEIKLKVGEVSIIADALYEEKGAIHVIEVDHTQKMLENKKKIDKYREILKLTGRMFWLHWITTTHYRQKQLKDLCEGLNVTVSLAKDHH